MQHQETEKRDEVELEGNSDFGVRVETEENTDGMQTNNAERITTLPTLKTKRRSCMYCSWCYSSRPAI